ncbi:MAG: hypothetical protein JWN70_7052 [Planctomycetaceae bacterium]|nr:hypothetical protein [Planctomycetaceae bacterium]
MASVLRRVLAGWLVWSMIGCAAASVWAQEATADPAAAAQPAAADGAAKKPPADSPLVVEPKTPEEIFEAVVLMVDLVRPDVAKLYLQKFMETDPPDDLLLALREKYGPGVFLKLSNIKDLQPLSIELLNRNNAAFARFAQDPARLDALLKDLVSGTGAQKTAAQFQMQTAGVHVVPALISALGNPLYAESQNALVEMLALIRDGAVPPLEAALTAPNPRVRLAAIQALGLIRNPGAIPHLLRFAGQTAPSEEKASASKAIATILGSPSIAATQSSGVASRLIQQARDYFNSKVEYIADTDKLVSTWVWSDQLGTVQERRVPPAQAALHDGLFFAKAALDVAPEQLDVQTSYLTMLLAQEAAISGIGKPIKAGPGTVHDLASSLGPDAVSRSLDEALEWRQTPAALAALQILSKIGTVQQVRNVSGRQSALQRALNYPNRRIQFAAVQTIVALDPTTRYPGTDRVIAVLGKGLTQAEATQHRGLVLDSVIERGQTLTGFLRTLGYEPSLVRTGRDGFKVAATEQEVDLVLIDANIQRWALSETIANFKADPRTKDVPIVIYGSSLSERSGRVQTQQYRNVFFIQEPSAAEDLKEQISGFMERQVEAPLTPEERSSKAVISSELLSFLTSGQRRAVYNLTPIEPQLVTAVENTQLAPWLLPVLGALPTLQAQSRIASLVGDDGFPMDVRTIAAKELTRHVRQHGLLIATEQVQALHQVWDQSSNGPLHAELSSLMGLLKPNSTLIGERLRGAAVNQPPTPEPAKP